MLQWNVNKTNLSLHCSLHFINLRPLKRKVHPNDSFFSWYSIAPRGIWRGADMLLAFYDIKPSKGQLILKCLFDVFNFSQKTNKNKSTWGIIVVKLNFFVRFLGEMKIPKGHIEINWPLARHIIGRIPLMGKVYLISKVSSHLSTKWRILMVSGY